METHVLSTTRVPSGSRAAKTGKKETRLFPSGGAGSGDALMRWFETLLKRDVEAPCDFAGIEERLFGSAGKPHSPFRF